MKCVDGFSAALINHASICCQPAPGFMQQRPSLAVSDIRRAEVLPKVDQVHCPAVGAQASERTEWRKAVAVHNGGDMQNLIGQLGSVSWFAPEHCGETEPDILFDQ